MKEITLTKISLFFLTVSLALLSCQSNSMQENKPEEFSISVSRGGGFTGLTNGFTLKSKGDILYWQKYINGKDTILWRATDDINKILVYKNKLISSGILAVEFNTTGNVTNYLAYSNYDTTYNWSWKEHDEQVPADVRQWFNDVNEYCKSIKKEK